MKTDYKVGDKVTILPFEVGTVGTRVYSQKMLQNIGLEGTVMYVSDSGVYVETSVAAWSYDFKFIKPLEETSMTSSAKPTAINVINQSPKVRAKLSKALVSLGYNLYCDYGAGYTTRIYNESRIHDLGVVSARSAVSTVDATDLKFKAVLKAVIPLLEFSAERPQVGDKVVVLDNPENLDGVYVGIVGTVKRDARSPSSPLLVELPNNTWWFNLDSVRVLKAAEKVETSSVAVKEPTVEARPEFKPKFKVGDTVKVVAHDRTGLPMDKTYTVTQVEDVGYTGSLPYRVKSGGTTDWVGHTALELVHEEPAELKQADFKFTRVKLKATGAIGVVIGRGTNSVCVQFDKPSDSLHSAGALRDYEGADKRCWFHNVAELEIIGDTHA